MFYKILGDRIPWSSLKPQKCICGVDAQDLLCLAHNVCDDDALGKVGFSTIMAWPKTWIITHGKCSMDIGQVWINSTFEPIKKGWSLQWIRTSKSKVSQRHLLMIPGGEKNRQSTRRMFWLERQFRRSLLGRVHKVQTNVKHQLPTYR